MSERTQNNLVALLSALALVLVILFSNTAHADEYTDRQETARYGNFFSSQPKLEFVFDAALAADMFTTLDIKNHRNADGTWALEEKNPLLGSHPSDGRIVGTCGVSAAVHALITYEMVSNGVPRGVVTAWEALSIGIEGGAAAHNLKVGLRFKF